MSPVASFAPFRARSPWLTLALAGLVTLALLSAAPAVHAAGGYSASILGGPSDGTAGGPISVSIGLAGESTTVPTGTVTTSLFALSDTACATPVASTTAAVTPALSGPTMGVARSTLTAPLAPGSYMYTESYSGDDVYMAGTTGCSPYQPVSITANVPSLSATAGTGFIHLGDSLTVGASLGADTAPTPTGDVTFELFPVNGDCTGSPAASSSPSALATGSAGHASTSTSFSPPAAGTYWLVASYPGDVSWAAGQSACSGAGTVTIADGLADPGLHPALSSTVTDIGLMVSETDTVTTPAYYPDPTGEIVEKWYGPGVSDCTGEPRSVIPQAVANLGFGRRGAGSGFGSGDRGTFSVISSYSGDANYLPASGTCQALTVRGPILQLSASSLSFASADAPQQVGTVGPTQTVTVTNIGDGIVPLKIDGFSFLGADSDDFLIGSSTCGGQILPGASCAFTVRFTPQGAGTRSAALSVLGGNVPAASLGLSGTGAALLAALPGPGLPGPMGPAGPAGTDGTNGTNGSVGKAGPDGQAGAAGAPASSAPALNLLCGDRHSGCRVQFRTPPRYHLMSARLVDRRGHSTMARFLSKGRVLLDAHRRPLRLHGGTYRVTIHMARTARWMLVRHYRLTVIG